MMTKTQAAVDMGAAIVLLIVGALLAAATIGALFPAGVHLVAILALQAMLVLLGVRLLLARHGETWRDIGLLPITLEDLGRAALAFLLCTTVSGIFSAVVYLISPQTLVAHFERLRLLAQTLSATEPLLATVLVLALVGFYEEVFARGLLLGRARIVVGGVWPPVLASSLLFGLGHWYQGWIGVLQTAVIGALFAALTLRWGTLWPVIVAHGAIDIVSITTITRLARGSA